MLKPQLIEHSLAENAQRLEDSELNIPLEYLSENGQLAEVQPVENDKQPITIGRSRRSFEQGPILKSKFKSTIN